MALPSAPRAAQRPLYLGPRLRRLRRELGLTQHAMASELDISPSYVALLERNQRPLTADLLLRLARSYRLDLAEFAGEGADDYARRLTEALRDPLFADIDLPALEIADLATSSPGVTEAFLRLHAAHARQQLALAAREAGTGADAPADPVGEARRFVAAHRNHFPVLDAAAEDVARELAAAGGADIWLKRQGTRVRFLPPDVMMGSLRRYDRHANQLLIDDTLPAPSRAFATALHIAYTVLRAPLAEALQTGEFTSPTATQLVRRALASYAAAALLMPYDRFARAVEARAYDIEALAGQFGTSFEMVAHRLTTLSRPGASLVPFFFLRVDAAGNVSKRLDGAGFPFAATGGGCPLWSVHDAFRRPGEVLTQWLELPGGERFFSIARSVESGGHSHARPRTLRAIALACAAEDAPKLVYAAGADPHTTPATPIGIACRVCDRAACTARAVPPVGREVLPDDTRRGREPFAFAES